MIQEKHHHNQIGKQRKASVTKKQSSLVQIMLLVSLKWMWIPLNNSESFLKKKRESKLMKEEGLSQRKKNKLR
jgi:hypothetical protein